MRRDGCDGNGPGHSWIAEELDLDPIVHQTNVLLARDSAFVATPPLVKKERVVRPVKAEHATVQKTSLGPSSPTSSGYTFFVEAKRLSNCRRG